MKIKIITVHDIGNNFGSTIQGCALCEFLNQNGYNAELINYIPNYRSSLQELKFYLTNLIFLPYYITRKHKFLDYYKVHACLTKKYIKYEQLKKNTPYADVYITGSDQVWNSFFPCGRDNAYYLQFVDSERKMSYAASVGRVLEENEIKILCENIKDYKYISLREKVSTEQLKSIGIKNAQYVLDPVFIYDKEYYVKNIRSNKIGKYLLVYATSSDNFLSRVAKEIAEKNNLKIIAIGGFKKKCDCDVFLRSAGPDDFINLIYHAEFILTSSFHATALAIILNKQFIVVQPPKNTLRIENILETAGISERAINNISNLAALLNTPIDYITINTKVDILRKHSIDFLLNNLNNFKNGIKEKKDINELV